MTRQMPFEPLLASVLFVFVPAVVLVGINGGADDMAVGNVNVWGRYVGGSVPIPATAWPLSRLTIAARNGHQKKCGQGQPDHSENSCG